VTSIATLNRVALPVIGTAIVLAIWQATIGYYGLARIVLPTPLEVINTLWKLLGSFQFWRDVRVSLTEFLLGYSIGGVTGIAVGVLIGARKDVRMVIGPVIEAMRFIVPFAWIPLTVLWFGTSLTGKVVLVAYAVFFVMVVTTARALATVEPTLTRVAVMLGMRPWEVAL
jgi:ABC-type nitrate/sulfonate/bicarbonate transport system permease component